LESTGGSVLARAEELAQSIAPRPAGSRGRSAYWKASSASTSFTTDAKFTRMTRIVVTQRLRQRRRANFLFLDEAPAA
jgi:hypothetical protein